MKNQENFNPHQKRKLIDANVDMTPILKLSDKHFKVATTKMFNK